MLLKIWRSSFYSVFYTLIHRPILSLYSKQIRSIETSNFCPVGLVLSLAFGQSSSVIHFFCSQLFQELRFWIVSVEMTPPAITTVVIPLNKLSPKYTNYDHGIVLDGLYLKYSTVAIKTSLSISKH